MTTPLASPGWENNDGDDPLDPAAFQALPALFFEWDVASDRVVRRGAFRQITGYDPTEAPPTSAWWRERIHPEDLEGMQGHIQQCLSQKREEYTAHYRVRHRDGHDVLCWENGKIDWDGDRLKQISGCTIDVTAWRRAEEDLKRTKASLERVIAAVPDVLYVYDISNARNVFSNREVEQILGYSAEDLRHTPLPELIHPEDREKEPARLTKLASLEDDEVWTHELRVRHRDGRYRHLRLREMVFARGSQGEVRQILGIAQDVTQEQDTAREQALLRTHLARAEARARRILDSGLIGILFWRLDGGVTYANDAFLRMVGYSRAELEEGRVDWRAMTPPEWDEVDARSIRQLQSCGVSELFTKQYRRKDGTLVDVLLGAAVFEPGSGEGVTMVVDISRQRQLEEQLRQQLAFEKELVGIVSHDLRSPIHVIALSASLARTRATDERLAAILGRISSNADRLARIVTDLLDATQARFTAGIPITRRETDLARVAKEILEDLRAAHPGRQIDLEMRGDLLGRWDPDRMGQVFQNLVANALRYGAEDAPVTVRLGDEYDEVRAEVHNHGRPIPPALLPVIFQPFRTTERRRSRDANSGMGLGLYIVESIVRSHGGTIQVRSNEEEGTTFTLRLPKGMADEARLDAE